MRILINASNLGPGGATQVADSFCCSLNQFHTDTFLVVLPPSMWNIAKKIKDYENVELYEYGIHNTWKTYLFARDKFLDDLAKEVEVVFSIFGPTWWTPRKPHLCGFALAHLVMPESPYFTSKPFIERLKLKWHNLLMTFFYWRCSRYYYTENPLISLRLKKLLHSNHVYTVTNYYNQVFDHPEQQHFHLLPKYDGTTIQTIASPAPHKNLSISIDIAKTLLRLYPDFNFRFIFTIEENQFPPIPKEIREHFLFIGKVDIAECPSIYEQCDISFQPTLLECFTATYPEAMRMKKPIVTTNLEFARSLCGEAAAYYDALSAKSAADAIYKVAMDIPYRKMLIQNADKELAKFDNYDERSSKLVAICKSFYN